MHDWWLMIEWWSIDDWYLIDWLNIDKTTWVIHWLIEQPFPSKSSKQHKSKIIRASILPFLHNVHHLSRFMCHVSHVTCHLVSVRCNLFSCFLLLLFWQIVGVYTFVVHVNSEHISCLASGLRDTFDSWIGRTVKVLMAISG